MKKLLLSVTLCLMGVIACAQIALEQFFDGYPVFFDGKYIVMDAENTKINIYNFDYSLYKVIDVSVPDGYSVQFGVSFPSKHLFNSDEKIEFVITAYDFTSYSGLILVYNEDGNVVYTISDNDMVLFPHSIVDYNGVSKMVVYGLDSQQKYHTYVYSLPGTYESAEGYCPDVANSCYPNPATNFVRLPYSLKKGSSDVLRVFDNNGALVEERYVGGDFGEILLDVSNYPSGVYFYECNGDTNRFIKQ